jgi:hypothetical protein
MNFMKGLGWYEIFTFNREPHHDSEYSMSCVSDKSNPTTSTVPIYSPGIDALAQHLQSASIADTNICICTAQAKLQA